MLYNNLYKYVFVLVLKLIQVNRKEENGTVDVIHSSFKYIKQFFICYERRYMHNEGTVKPDWKEEMLIGTERAPTSSDTPF